VGLLLSCLLLPCPAPPQEAPAPPPPVWERVVVVGASAAAGFGTAREAGGTDVPLGRFLEPMLRRDHEEVLDPGDALFFLNPRGKGRSQVELAREEEPTLLVAVDFLFWFTYGLPPGDRDPMEWRLELLEEGLELLGDFSCPVLVAEVPDMRRAIGTMLLAEQVPAPAELARLNRRIREWAAGHPEVVLVPLAAELERLREQDVGRRERGEPPLLQWDHLHPTLPGLARLAALCLESLRESRPGLPAAAFALDAAATLARVREDLRLGAPATGS